MWYVTLNHEFDLKLHAAKLVYILKSTYLALGMKACTINRGLGKLQASPGFHHKVFTSLLRRSSTHKNFILFDTCCIEVLCLKTYCSKILLNDLNQVHANWCGFKAWIDGIDGWLDHGKSINTGCGWNSNVECAYLFMQHIYIYFLHPLGKECKNMLFLKIIFEWF